MLMLDIKDEILLDVRPPLNEAKKISKTKNIGILGTKSARLKVKNYQDLLKKKFNSEIKIHKINGSSIS